MTLSIMVCSFCFGSLRMGHEENGLFLVSAIMILPWLSICPVAVQIADTPPVPDRSERGPHQRASLNKPTGHCKGSIGCVAMPSGNGRRCLVGEGIDPQRGDERPLAAVSFPRRGEINLVEGVVFSGGKDRVIDIDLAGPAGTGQLRLADAAALRSEERRVGKECI